MRERGWRHLASVSLFFAHGVDKGLNSILCKSILGHAGERAHIGPLQVTDQKLSGRQGLKPK